MNDIQLIEIPFAEVYGSKWTAWCVKFPILSSPDVYQWLQAKAQKYAVGRDVSNFKLQTYAKYLQDYCTHYAVTDVANLLREPIENRDSRLRSYLNHLLQQGVNKVSVANAIQAKIKSFFSARGFPIKYQLKTEAAGLNKKEIVLNQERIQMIENGLNSPNYRLILKLQTQLGLRISDILLELPSGKYTLEHHANHYFIRNFETQKEQVTINYLFFPDELSKLMSATTHTPDLTQLDLTTLFHTRQQKDSHSIELPDSTTRHYTKGNRIHANVYLRQLKIVAAKLGFTDNLKTHTFRKYFRTSLKRSQVDREMMEHLMGHTGMDLSQAYNRDLADLPYFYQVWCEQVEPWILIDSVIVDKTNEEVVALKEANLALEARMDLVMHENLTMKNDLKALTGLVRDYIHKATF